MRHVQAGLLGGIIGGGDSTTTTPTPEQTTTNPGSTSSVNPPTSDNPPSTTTTAVQPTMPSSTLSQPSSQTTPLPVLPTPSPLLPTTNQPSTSYSASTSTSHQSSSSGNNSNYNGSTTSQQSSSSNAASASATNASETDNATQKSSSGSNTGIIIGSVCAFVAIIGAGFGYAFLSKTRKKSRKNRLFDEGGLPTHDYNSPDNNKGSNAPRPFETRPSPAIAAAAVAGGDIHHQQQQKPYNNWEDSHAESPYMYNHPSHGMSPQMPPAVAPPATAHDPYYSPSMTAPALNPAMNYPDAGVSGAYYNTHAPVSNAAPAHYYDAAYNTNQYDTYPQQQHYTGQPAVAPMAASGPTYSAPHTYDEPPAQAAQHQSPNTYDQSYPVGHDQQQPNPNTYQPHQQNATGHGYGGGEWSYR